MKTSARNQLTGVVSSIRAGEVLSEVALTLPSQHELIATITTESLQRLKLKVGNPVIALIKSSNIIIATDLAHIQLSARNCLDGIIGDVQRGAVNSVITLNLGNETIITAGVTMQSAEQLDLHPGQKATAVFKAGSVILGVLA